MALSWPYNTKIALLYADRAGQHECTARLSFPSKCFSAADAFCTSRRRRSRSTRRGPACTHACPFYIHRTTLWQLQQACSASAAVIAGDGRVRRWLRPIRRIPICCGVGCTSPIANSTARRSSFESISHIHQLGELRRTQNSPHAASDVCFAVGTSSTAPPCRSPAAHASTRTPTGSNILDLIRK